MAAPPISDVDRVRAVYPAACCRPATIQESMPIRVATWQIVDDYDNTTIGSEAPTEAQAWALAAEALDK